MAVKQWSVGDVLTAADMNAWTVPLAAIKTSGQTISATTALVTDASLVVPVAINQYYFITAVIEYNATTGGDIKWTWTIPAGASGWYGYTCVAVAGGWTSGSGNNWTDTAGINAGGSGVGSPNNVRMHGILNMAGTAGNLQFKWSQNVASGSTTVMGNSAIIGQQIG